MMFKKKSVDLSKINSFIAPGNRIEGKFIFNGTLKIGGSILGSVVGSTDGHDNHGESVLIVDGSVEGELIDADHVVIAGHVSVTKIIAKKSLSISKNAHVKSDSILYSEFSVEQGALIEGVLARIKPNNELDSESKEQW